jgi:hypothetical protein
MEFDKIHVTQSRVGLQYGDMNFCHQTEEGINWARDWLATDQGDILYQRAGPWLFYYIIIGNELTNPMGRRHFEKFVVVQLVKKFSSFVKTEGSLFCSLQIAIGLYLKLDELILRKMSFWLEILGIQKFFIEISRLLWLPLQK